MELLQTNWHRENLGIWWNHEDLGRLPAGNPDLIVVASVQSEGSEGEKLLSPSVRT